MNALWNYLAEHGGMLLCGATFLLGLGSLAMWVERSPIHRRRAGELALLGVLVWLVLALVPMPRWSPGVWRPSEAGDEMASAVAPSAPVREASTESRGATLPAPLDDLESPLAFPGVPLAPVPAASGRLPDVSARAESLLASAPEEQQEPEWMGFPEPRSWSVAMVRASVGDWLSSKDFRRWMAAAYVAGSLACAGWLLLGRMLLARMLWSARPAQAWVGPLCRELGWRRRRALRVLVSSRTARALCFGLWRPTVVLPEAACRPEHRDALRHVLRHEMAHLRQGDPWGQALFNLALPLMYVHPLYWWVRVRANLAAELVADDQAASGLAKESYVGALVDLVRQCGRSQRVGWIPQGMSSSPSQFYRRMQMLLSRNSRLAWRCSWRWRLIYPAASIVVVALLAGTLGVRPVPAQEPDAVARLEQQVADLKGQLEAVRAEGESLRQERAALQQEIVSLQQRLTKIAPADPAAVRPATKAVAETARPKVTRVYQLKETAADDVNRLLKLLVSTGRAARIGVDSRTGKVIVEADAQQHEAIGEAIRLLEEVIRKPVGKQEPRQSTLAPDRTGPEQPEAKGGGDGKPRSASTKAAQTVPLPTAERATDVHQLRQQYAAGELDMILAALRRLAPSARIEQAPRGDALVVAGDKAQLQAISDAIAAMERQAEKRAEQARAAAEAGRTEAPRIVADRLVRSALPSADPALARGESAPLDLVGLANSCLDAAEKLSIAQIEFAELKPLEKERAVSQHDLAIAQVRLKAAERRLESLRGLVQDALAAAKDEHSTLRPFFEARQASGTADPDRQSALKIQVQRAESRLRMLERILATCQVPEPAPKDPPAKPKAPAGKY